MSTYIDFIESMSQNKALAHEFKQGLQQFSEAELSSWFHGKGYSVSSTECGSIMKNTKSGFSASTLMAGY